VGGALIEVDGKLRDVRAHLTLAADGLRSRFARRLGLGGSESRRRKFGLAARYRTVAGGKGPLGMFAGGPGCCGIAVREEEANLGMVADARWVRAIGGDPAAFFHAHLADFPELAERVEGTPISVRTVGPLTWTTRRQSTAGCLLLGDAAGYYDPFTGEGVTFALQSAALAAEVAAAAFAEGDFSERRLSEYDRRRSAVIAPRIRLQKMIQTVVSRPWLFDAALRRLERRPELARTLIAAVADVSPVRGVAAPAFVRQWVGF
jgi:flavin-dependent dehydrogenase